MAGKSDIFKKGTEALEIGAKKESGPVSKFVDALSAPQKKLSKMAAEVAGLNPEDESAANFAMLADLIGDKMGVPRDSTAGNAVKALGVAGAEVFADPLGMVPVGKIAKGAKGLKSMVQGSDKFAEALRLMGMAGKVDETAKVAGLGENLVKPIEQSVTGQKWAGAAGQMAAEKAAAVKPASNVVSMADKLKDSRNLQVKEQAKKFAKEAVKAELEKQPALKHNPDYLKTRIQELANFFFAQKRSK